MNGGRVMAAALLLGVAGCSLAPRAAVPAVGAVPAHFKEAPGWAPAAPADAVARAAWWQGFADPVLDGLMQRLAVDNQNLAAARAAYAAARALVQQQRAALFPSLTASGTATRAQLSQPSVPGSVTPPSISASGSRYALNIGASWEPDLWGRIADGLRGAEASAAASAGDLASATLAARGELATNYVQLRGLDAQKQLLDRTIADYARALQMARNQYAVGTVARSDIDQAQTTLENAIATRATLDQQRATLEHAIAVLVGANPSDFALAPADWAPVVPEVPGVLPASLLERRPDIAAAERRVAAANAAIGVNRAAYFPQLTLSGGFETSGSAVGALFAAASNLWSFGASGLLTLFDFGARQGAVRQAEAQHAQAVANYRQTVLGAFQQVEDNLAGVRVLGDVATARSRAAVAAGRAERIILNQYQAGLVDYGQVIIAETASLGARQAEIEAVVDRQAAAIALVQAIGGDWGAARAGDAGEAGED